MKKLIQAYFPNKTNVDAIKSGNIALVSDIYVGDNVLKAIAYHANANSKTTDKIQHKNTFFFRYSQFKQNNETIGFTKKKIIVLE